MKRFLLFGYSGYYPSGGMNDFRGEFDTREEAIVRALSPPGTSYVEEYYDLLDTATGEVDNKEHLEKAWRKLTASAD